MDDLKVTERKIIYLDDAIDAITNTSGIRGDALKALYDLPSAQPERKKGEWVNARDGYDGHVKCNKCFKTYDWTSDAQYFNFCPHCGADMRGEGNEISRC